MYSNSELVLDGVEGFILDELECPLCESLQIEETSAGNFICYKCDNTLTVLDMTE